METAPSGEESGYRWLVLIVARADVTQSYTTCLLVISVFSAVGAVVAFTLRSAEL